MHSVRCQHGHGPYLLSTSVVVSSAFPWPTFFLVWFAGRYMFGKCNQLRRARWRCNVAQMSRCAIIEECIRKVPDNLAKKHYAAYASMFYGDVWDIADIRGLQSCSAALSTFSVVTASQSVPQTTDKNIDSQTTPCRYSPLTTTRCKQLMSRAS